MVTVDYLADTLNTLKTHETAGQRRCSVRATKLIEKVLSVLREHGYLKEFRRIESGKVELFDVELDGRINDCGIIKPRFPVKRQEWSEVEQRYIPAVSIGLLIVSTSQGIMTNSDAEKRHIGGRLLAYIY